jgi:hypothetical protein
MIPVNELRVGNIVTLTGNEVASPLDIMIDEVNFPITRKRGEYNPIPISPEWLERFNFEMDDDMEYGIIWSFKISDDASIYWNGFIEIEVRTKYVTTRYDLDHIKHIHQLQNLYHSLTGKELELKEKV